MNDETSTDSALDPVNVRDILSDWWREMSEQEIEKVVPKAVEYGATDLAELGRVWCLSANRDVSQLGHEELTELGIYVYVFGKFARWLDAVKTGRRVSDDTLYDIGVYVRMAQRNRAVGGWPFDPNEHKEYR